MATIRLGDDPGRGAAYGYEIRAQSGEVQRTCVSQGPRERPPALGGVQAGLVEVQGRTPAGRPVIRVGESGRTARDLGHDHS